MIGHHWLGIVGILLITLANYDAIKTTLSASHSGPLTNRSISTVWTLLLALHQRHRCHRVLSAAGPWLTVGLMTVWLLLALVGWWLLFCSTEDAVVNATTKAPANDVERLYYAGYTLTTLGYGDFVPGSDTWRLAPPLAAANGCPTDRQKAVEVKLHTQESSQHEGCRRKAHTSISYTSK